MDLRLNNLPDLVCPLWLIAYRSTVPKLATELDLITGEGARTYGGRWNPPGVAAVYASDSPEVAMAEALATVRYYRFPVHAFAPRCFVSLSFDLERVVDLTDGETRRRIGLSRRRMVETDWRTEMAGGAVPLTQLVGQAAAESGLDGLLVPSAAKRDGKNVVAFPANFQGSSLVVLAPDKL